MGKHPPIDERRRARFPSEQEIYAHAVEMFFHERDSGRPFEHYWRAAENELLDRAARKVIGRRDR